jgi:hypothetical protein
MLPDDVVTLTRLGQAPVSLVGINTVELISDIDLFHHESREQVPGHFFDRRRVLVISAYSKAGSGPTVITENPSRSFDLRSVAAFF